MAQKIALYHEGPAASQKIADALKAKGVRLAGRNSLFPVELEAFDLVVVDGSKSSDKFAEAYKAKGMKVQTIEEFLGGELPKEPKAAPFNPDAPVKAAKGKKQG
jgi:hypothetical protein